MERKGQILMTGVNLVPHIMEGTKVSNECFGGQLKNKKSPFSLLHSCSVGLSCCGVYEFAVSSVLGSTISYQNIANIMCYIPPRGQTLMSNVLVFSIIAK